MAATAPALSGVRYDDAAHTYHSPGGLWLPGATRILSDNGYTPGSEWFTPDSRRRGKAVHFACYLADVHCPKLKQLGPVLDVIDLDVRLHEYLEGYLFYKRETGFTPEMNEQPVWSKTYNAAGCLDKWGRHEDGSRVLVDLKSWKSQGSKPKPAAEIQTGGYDLMLYESLGVETDSREVVALPGNGKYRRYVCANPADKQVFRMNCNIWWDKANRGIIQRGGDSEVELAA